MVQDVNQCTDDTTISIKVEQTPVGKFTVTDKYNGKQGQIKLNNFSDGNSFFWDFGNGKKDTVREPVALYTENGSYTIKLLSSVLGTQCTDTSYYQYNLLFQGLYVPNAFAPNSNNLGVRLFQPKGSNVTTYHLRIFDMWGHQVYESQSLDEGWDGNFEGAPQPSGNYMWTIEATFQDGSSWGGSDTGATGSGKTMGNLILIR